MERGQYPSVRKEHIANEEQIVYIPAIAVAASGKESSKESGKERGTSGERGRIVGLPNPGHKEQDQ